MQSSSSEVSRKPFNLKKTETSARRQDFEFSGKRVLRKDNSPHSYLQLPDFQHFSLIYRMADSPILCTLPDPDLTKRLQRWFVAIRGPNRCDTPRRTNEECSEQDCQPEANSVQTCLDVCRFDPFMTLPVNAFYVGEVAQWHFETIKLDNNLMRSRWASATQNEGLFHSLLCTSLNKKAAATGQRDDIQYFYHQGQALQAIYRGLRGKSPKTNTFYYRIS